jgi:predicted nucleotidyltransferase
VRLFGSVLGPGFHEGSDLDLVVEGLPGEALLEALALAERFAERVDAAALRLQSLYTGIKRCLLLADYHSCDE